jgi:hypothetical protein
LEESSLQRLPIAIKLINCIEHVHTKGKMIPRDIKLDNLTFGHQVNSKQKKRFNIDLDVSELYFMNG